MKFLITGGAGFIGSALCRHIINNTQDEIVVLDKLTYAGSKANLEELKSSPRYYFELADICDEVRVADIFQNHQPDVVIHLAAESHVDRSIDGPKLFIETNIIGTFVLLEYSRKYWADLEGEKKSGFRFHHVSTDEVFGDLLSDAPAFTETSSYQPSSPYSASKASSDHLVRAWHRTYGLPIVLTNCSNNYGAYQLCEKLIPLTIINALKGEKLPVYGDGQQIRDWLFVDDHAKALYAVATQGALGETYNIGGNNEIANIEVVNTICELLEELAREKPEGVKEYRELITFVKDRPGHDVRYAINSEKIKQQLGWEAEESFKSGLRKTVLWYLSNPEWIKTNQDNAKQRKGLVE